jgi:hypothetical protein
VAAPSHHLHRLAALLTVLAAGLVLPRAAMVGEPFAFNYNEGWNLYRAMLVQSGGLVFAAAPDFWVANYPSLSFHIVAAVGLAIGDLSLAGRLLALLGLVGTCVFSGATVARVTGNRAAGMCAGLLPAVWIGLYLTNRIAMNDPQLLATAVMMAALWCYLRGWLMASAVVAVTALFIKHNLLDLPAAMLLHLAWARRWRDVALWLATAAVAGTALLTWSFAQDGPYLFAHLLTGRSYSLPKGLRMTGGFLLYLLGALVVALLWARHHAAPTTRGFLVLALAASIAMGVVQAPGGGVDRNAFLDALVVLAMVTGVALHDASGWFCRQRPVVVALVMLSPVLPGVVKLPERLWSGVAALHEAPARREAFEAGRIVLAAARPPALCEDLMLCFASGQPLDYDPFFANERMRQGSLDTARVMALLAAQHWGAVVLDSAPILPGVERERFSGPVIGALLAAYRPAFTADAFVILLPVEPNSTDAQPRTNTP